MLASREAMHQQLESALARQVTVLRVASGCPNPDSASWKILAEFSHPAGVGTVSLWESGCCDIDFLPESAPDGIALHGEFTSEADVCEYVAWHLDRLFSQYAPSSPRNA